MKTCPKCNAQLADDVVFCNECGARLEAAQPAADSVAPAAPAAPKAPLDPAKIKKYATYGGIGVAALIVIIILCSIIGANSGPKAAIKGFMNAYKAGNFKTLVNYVIPKDAQEDYLDEYYDAEVSEVTEALTDYSKTMWKDIKKVGKVKVTYKIKNFENIKKPKELKSFLKNQGISDLDDFRDALDFLETYGSDVEKIKAAYICEFEYKVELGGKRVLKGEGHVAVYKYGGKYLLSGDVPSPTELYNTIKYDEKLSDKYDDMLEDIDELEDEYDVQFNNRLW